MPNGADYELGAEVCSDGEAGIFAKRFGSGDEEMFWSSDLEIADFSSVHELQESFLETLALLLDNPTRIFQKKGLLFMHFECAYLSDGEWYSVGGYAGYRFSDLEFPEIVDKEKEYRSAPVRS